MTELPPTEEDLDEMGGRGEPGFSRFPPLLAQTRSALSLKAERDRLAAERDSLAARLKEVEGALREAFQMIGSARVLAAYNQNRASEKAFDEWLKNYAALAPTKKEGGQ